MTYQRKTRDTWELHVNYGQGWEHEVTEFSWRAAREQAATYRREVPQYPVRLLKRREPIQGAAS